MYDKITVLFRVYSNAKKTKKVLKLCAKAVGSTQYSPRTIQSFNQGSLVDPDIERWDQSLQRFKKNAMNADINNGVLERVESLVLSVLEQCKPSSTKDLWNACDAVVGGIRKAAKPSVSVLPNVEAKAPDSISFGDFIRGYIEELKEGRNNRLPSKNFQIFLSLLHHLEREQKAEDSKNIIDIPVYELSDQDFADFGKYLCTLDNPNYIPNMKYFKRLHNRAVERGLAPANLTYKYSDHQPVKTYKELKEGSKSVASLSLKQFNKFEKLDVSQIFLSGVNREFYKQLYKDTCLLMFYLYSRPIDIFNLRYEDVKKCAKGYYIEYLPIKKKNNKSAQADFVKCPVCKEALEIMRKYKGVSTGGYVLPYSENKRAWCLDNPKEYLKRFNRCNSMLGKVNSFLKKVADNMKISFPNDTFSMYVFRHSAISIAILNKNIPPLVVAKMAGTSLKEIERSYMDHTATMFDYV